MPPLTWSMTCILVNYFMDIITLQNIQRKRSNGRENCFGSRSRTNLYPAISDSNLLKFRRLFGNRHTICLKVIELEIVVMVMIVMVMVVNRVNQTFNGKRY